MNGTTLHTPPGLYVWLFSDTDLNDHCSAPLHCSNHQTHNPTQHTHLTLCVYVLVFFINLSIKQPESDLTV